jgi:hypothetical protein
MPERAVITDPSEKATAQIDTDSEALRNLLCGEGHGAIVRFLGYLCPRKFHRRPAWGGGALAKVAIEELWRSKELTGRSAVLGPA